jgi:hypothetical protein
MGHGVKTEISNVCLFRQDEATKQEGRIGNNAGFGIYVDTQVDSLEKDGVLGVVVLNILRNVNSASYHMRSSCDDAYFGCLLGNIYDSLKYTIQGVQHFLVV